MEYRVLWTKCKTLSQNVGLFWWNIGLFYHSSNTLYSIHLTQKNSAGDVHQHSGDEEREGEGRGGKGRRIRVLENTASRDQDVLMVWLCDMTRLYVWHDSFLCVTWLISMCDMTRSYVWHDSFLCATWLIHMLCGKIHSYMRCDVFVHEKKTHSYVRHDTFMRETWLVSPIPMSHVSLMYVTWRFNGIAMSVSHRCVIWRVWHDSFVRATWRIRLCLGLSIIHVCLCCSIPSMCADVAAYRNDMCHNVIHFTHINEACHTCVIHTGMIHVSSCVHAAHIKESSRGTHVIHFTHINKSRHTCVTHTRIIDVFSCVHVAHINGSCGTHVIHITHMNESCHTRVSSTHVWSKCLHVFMRHILMSWVVAHM